jgi:hypothetical protein
MRNAYYNFGMEENERDCLEDLGVSGRIILDDSVGNRL